MAEKEACADIVASVTADLQRERQLQQQQSTDSSASGIHGESLLLPLLQGILLHNKSGAGGQVGTASAGSGGRTSAAVSLPIPPVEDSGTESGEDLRLLAAGLHDNIEMYRGIGVGNAALNGGINGDGSSVSNGRLPVDSGESILHEVTAALQRLQLSLRDGKDINLATNKRNALLTLVCRLQTGLMQPDQLPEQVSPVNELADDTIEDDKVDYNQARRGSARFAKRRNRNNRHTVGVSREELADARRFIEEIGRMSSKSHSATPEKSKTPEKSQLAYSLQKQQSLGTVLPSEVPMAPSSTFAMKRPSQFVPKELNQKANATTQMVNGRDRKAKQKLFRQSQSFDQTVINGYEPPTPTQHKPIDVKPLPVSKNEPFKKPVQTAAQRALVKKYSFNDGSTSEDDEPRKTAEQVVLQKNTTKGTAVINTVQKIVNREVKQDPPVKSVHPSVSRKAAIHRSHTPEAHEAPVSGGEGNNKPINKYTSKKLRMKRANTIDIPKKLLNADSDDDSDNEQQQQQQQQKPRTERPREVKAKTPVSSVVKPVVAADVPDFKPKTENDMKFMAFLQKQNQAPRQMWTNPVKEHVGSNNWTSKFDHLKHNFESAGRQGSQLPPMRSAPKNSAMNFWKKAESNSFDESHLRHPKPPMPVQNHHVAPKPPTQPKLPPRQQQAPPALPAKPKSTPQPLPQPVVVSKPEPKHPPTIGSQFTHAPTSAFKPIPKKLPPTQLDFKPIPQEPEIVKPIPAHVSCGIVKQIVASGFKETPEVKPEPMQVQLGLVKSLAAAGYHETPYVPLPKLERTPTHNVLNYQALNPDRAESPPTPPAPWVGKKSTEVGNTRVASIASTKFTANQFGLNKGNLPTQAPLTYQGSLKYNEKPLSLQMNERLQEKRPSLPDVHKTLPKPVDNFMYTFTDYTQPESISTFTLNRSDSLTNPENQPLVLTSTNSVYSPAGQQMTYLGVGERRNSSSLSPNVVDDDAPDDLDSLDSQEMRVVSKVMQAPVSQQASYSSNKPSHLNSANADDRGSMIAQNLHSTLKKIQHKSPTPPNKLAIAAAAAAQKRFSHDFSGSLDGLSNYAAQRSAPQFTVPKVEVTPQTPATMQQHVPHYGLPSHVVYNNVPGLSQNRPQFQPAPLSRTDSWVRLNQQPAPNALSRAKSSHTLAVPQSFDGGYGQPNRTVTDKQRTMEAYFSGQKPALHNLAKTASTHNILRDKSGMTQNSVRPVSYAMGHSYNPAQYNIMTQQHHGSSYQPNPSMYAPRTQPMMAQQPQTQYYQPPLGGGLSRSRTMPHIPMNNVSLLDEENVEDAFEELMSQSFAV